MSSLRRPTCVFLLVCIALSIGAASGRDTRGLRQPAGSVSHGETEARNAASLLAPTGEWLEMPVDAFGCAHAILETDGYVDVAKCARAIEPPANDETAGPRPWRRSPRPDVYVDLGAWASTR